jgi:hypothetical protein
MPVRGVLLLGSVDEFLSPEQFTRLQLPVQTAWTLQRMTPGVDAFFVGFELSPYAISFVNAG